MLPMKFIIVRRYMIHNKKNIVDKWPICDDVFDIIVSFLPIDKEYYSAVFDRRSFSIANEHNKNKVYLEFFVNDYLEVFYFIASKHEIKRTHTRHKTCVSIRLYNDEPELLARK